MASGSVTDNTALLTAAHEYAAYGWRLVPLHSLKPDGHCTCNRGEQCGVGGRGKHPRVTEWQKKASCEAATIERWWGQQWPAANIGVKLGPESGIIDVECDSDEAERALSELFDHDFPITPTWLAARGKHRLFQWTDDLPGATAKAVLKFHGIEFRVGGGGLGAQSVLPPSRHPSGAQYRWLVDPATVDVAVLPAAVIERLRGGSQNSSKAASSRPQSARHALYGPDVIGEGGRDNTLYAEACAMWREMFLAYGDAAFDSLDQQKSVYQRLWAWNQAKCAPPLDDSVVLQKCNGARAFIRESMANENPNKGCSLTALGLEHREGEWWPGQWHVETINSDPPEARLYAPFLPKKFIEINMEDFNSPTKVHLAVLKATGTVCLDDRPKVWPSIWNGYRDEDGKSHRGLKAKLLDDSQWIEAPPETRREYVIAELLVGAIAKAKRLEQDVPDTTQRPCELPDGTVVFVYRQIWEDMARSDDKITRSELSKFLDDIGATERQHKVNGRATRFKVLSRGTQTQLGRIMSLEEVALVAPAKNASATH